MPSTRWQRADRVLTPPLALLRSVQETCNFDALFSYLNSGNYDFRYDLSKGYVRTCQTEDPVQALHTSRSTRAGSG